MMIFYTLALTMWKYVKTSYLIEVKYKFAHNYNFNIYIVGGKMKEEVLRAWHVGNMTNKF